MGDLLKEKVLGISIGDVEVISYVNVESKKPLRTGIRIKRTGKDGFLLYVGTPLATEVTSAYFADPKLKLPEEIEKK